MPENNGNAENTEVSETTSTDNAQTSMSEATENTSAPNTENTPDTQTLIDNALAQARETWESELTERIKSEREDAANLARMSEKEQQTELEKRQRAADEKARTEFERERNVFHCEQQLAASGLPTEFAQMLTGSSAKETKDNIDNFSALFQSAVTKASRENMKGTAPAIGGTSGGGKSDPFLMGFGA